jgi:soluble lytic murein transglycosylase-like protein
MVTDDLNELIYVIAQQHVLPPPLVEAIVRAESGGNTWAIRYEPKFYDRYIDGKTWQPSPGASFATEQRSLAFSWGLMQVMGSTARSEGFTGTFLSELCDPAVGLDIGCRHLSTLDRRFPVIQEYTWYDVCAAYNGGAGAVISPGVCKNPAYPEKILRLLGGEWPAR